VCHNRKIDDSILDCMLFSKCLSQKVNSLVEYSFNTRRTSTTICIYFCMCLYSVFVIIKRILVAPFCHFCFFLYFSFIYSLLSFFHLWLIFSFSVPILFLFLVFHCLFPSFLFFLLILLESNFRPRRSKSNRGL
jgi:hypothetical protein